MESGRLVQLDEKNPGYLGHPRSNSTCWLLDLATLGKSSRRYPIAPDGHIPNSVIRSLYDLPEATSKDAGIEKGRKPFRLRTGRKFPAAVEPTADEKEDISPEVDEVTRWTTWADSEGGPVSSQTVEDEDEIDDGVSTRSGVASKIPTSPTESPEVEVQEEEKAANDQMPPKETSQPEKRPRRRINAGGPKLPPLPNQQQLRLLREKREQQTRLAREEKSQRTAEPEIDPEPEANIDRENVEIPEAKPTIQHETTPPSQTPKTTNKRTTQGLPQRRKMPPAPPVSRQKAQLQPRKQLEKRVRKQSLPPMQQPQRRPFEPIQDDDSAPVEEPEVVADDTVELEIGQEEPKDFDGADAVEVRVESPASSVASSTVAPQGVQDIPQPFDVSLVVEVPIATGEDGEVEDAEDKEYKPEELLEPEDENASGHEAGLEVEMAGNANDADVSDSEDNEQAESEEMESETGRELSLLELIIAEPWFRQSDVLPLTEPVARALTELMAGTDTTGQEHEEMCHRLVDIKRQLNFESEFELQVVSEIVHQLEQLIAEWMTLERPESLGNQKENDEFDATGEKQTDEESDSLIDQKRKGDNLVELLRELGHEFIDLNQRWSDTTTPRHHGNETPDSTEPSSTAAVPDNIAVHMRPRGRDQRRHGRHADSGVGTDSAASDEILPAAAGENLPEGDGQELAALTEEERQTTIGAVSAPTTTVVNGGDSDRDSEDSMEDLEGLLRSSIDGGDGGSEVESGVRFLLPLEVLTVGDEGEETGRESLWLPPIPTPPIPFGWQPPANEKELTVFDLMADYRLKRMIERLPPIEPINLEAISERSIQTAYRCPRLDQRQVLPWLEQHVGLFNERDALLLTRPDTTNYAATWRQHELQPTAEGTTVDVQSRLVINSMGAAVGEGRKKDLAGEKSSCGHRHPGRKQPRKDQQQQQQQYKDSSRQQPQLPPLLLLEGEALLAGLPESQPRVTTERQESTQPRETALPPLTHRASHLWPGHCRMDSLARHGFHRPGLSIGRHVSRDQLLLLPPLRSRSKES